MKIYAFADEASPLLDEQIIACKNNGISGIEMRNVDNENISDISLKKAAEFKKKLDDSGLITWSIGSPIGKIDIVNDDFSKHIEKFKNTLEIAKILDSHNLRLFSFYIPKGDEPGKYKDTVIERLGVFSELARPYDIMLCHENEKGIFGDTPERCLEIHKALPDIRCIFDPANFVQCGVDTKKAWEILKGYVHYLHIKDALSNGSVVPAGKGVGNLKYILDDFAKSGGDCVTLEPHLTIFDGLKNLEKSGMTSKVGEKYCYSSNIEAFKAAADALKILL